jgi:hypothetical protein
MHNSWPSEFGLRRSHARRRQLGRHGLPVSCQTLMLGHSKSLTARGRHEATATCSRQGSASIIANLAEELLVLVVHLVWTHSVYGLESSRA